MPKGAAGIFSEELLDNLAEDLAERVMERVSRRLSEAEPKKNAASTPVPTVLASGKKLLSVQEVAEELSLSANAVYVWVRSGKLPHVKLGRRVMIPRESVEKMLVEGTD